MHDTDYIVITEAVTKSNYKWADAEVITGCFLSEMLGLSGCIGM